MISASEVLLTYTTIPFTSKSWEGFYFGPLRLLQGHIPRVRENQVMIELDSAN